MCLGLGTVNKHMNQEKQNRPASEPETMRSGLCYSRGQTAASCPHLSLFLNNAVTEVDASV